jgi:hypothetical protein
MQSFRTFAYSFFRSATSPLYYHDIIHTRFSFSLKFFLFFSLLFATTATVYFWIFLIRPLKPAILSIPSNFATIYPPELEIVIQDGQVSTNVSEPYFIPVSQLNNAIENIRNQVLGASTAQNDYLLVIDTKADIEDFYLYQTYALLTQNYLVYVSNEDSPTSQLRVINLQEVSDVTVNQQTVTDIVNQLNPYMPYVLPLGILVVFINFSLLLSLGRGVQIAFSSVLLFLFAKLIKFPLTYSQSYQIGLHLIVPITLISSLLDVLNLNFIPGFVSKLLIIASLFILVYLKRHTTTNNPAQIHPHNPEK